MRPRPGAAPSTGGAHDPADRLGAAGQRPRAGPGDGARGGPPRDHREGAGRRRELLRVGEGRAPRNVVRQRIAVQVLRPADLVARCPVLLRRRGRLLGLRHLQRSLRCPRSGEPQRHRRRLHAAVHGEVRLPARQRGRSRAALPEPDGPDHQELERRLRPVLHGGRARGKSLRDLYRSPACRTAAPVGPRRVHQHARRHRLDAPGVSEHRPSARHRLQRRRDRDLRCVLVRAQRPTAATTTTRASPTRISGGSARKASSPSGRRTRTSS